MYGNDVISMLSHIDKSKYLTIIPENRCVSDRRKRITENTCILAEKAEVKYPTEESFPLFPTEKNFDLWFPF